MTRPKHIVSNATAHEQLLASSVALPQLVMDYLNQLQQPGEFAKALKAHRHNLGMTQEKLASHYGVCVRTYKRWEEGKCWPEGDNILKILSDEPPISSQHQRKRAPRAPSSDGAER